MIYIDPLRYYERSHVQRAARRYGHFWSHIFADDVKELHAFASKLGLRRAYFQANPHPHYDVATNKRQPAIRAGAVEMTTKDILRHLRAKVTVE